MRPQQFLGAPPRKGAAVLVPAHRGASLVSVNADAVEPPAAAAAGGSEGGEGLADPVVLRFLEVVGQDSFLVLQLLEKESTDREKRSRKIPHTQSETDQNVPRCFNVTVIQGNIF